MTACMPLLWRYDDTDPGTPGRIQVRCGCGWVTDTYPDSELSRGRIADRTTAHLTERKETAA